MTTIYNYTQKAVLTALVIGLSLFSTIATAKTVAQTSFDIKNMTADGRARIAVQDFPETKLTLDGTPLTGNNPNFSLAAGEQKNLLATSPMPDYSVIMSLHIVLKYQAKHDKIGCNFATFTLWPKRNGDQTIIITPDHNVVFNGKTNFGDSGGYITPCPPEK